MPDSIIKVNNITSLNGLHGPGFPDGSAESPSFNFINEPTSGIYRISDGLLGISIKGVKAAEINLDGIKGSQGIQGPQGIQGEIGPIGPKGDTGSLGPQGIQGPKGDTGPQGVQGPKGDTGLEGRNSNFIGEIKQFRFRRDISKTFPFWNLALPDQNIVALNYPDYADYLRNIKIETCTFSQLTGTATVSGTTLTVTSQSIPAGSLLYFHSVAQFRTVVSGSGTSYALDEPLSVSGSNFSSVDQSNYTSAFSGSWQSVTQWRLDDNGSNRILLEALTEDAYYSGATLNANVITPSLSWMTLRWNSFDYVITSFNPVTRDIFVSGSANTGTGTVELYPHRIVNSLDARHRQVDDSVLINNGIQVVNGLRLRDRGQGHKHNDSGHSHSYSAALISDASGSFLRNTDIGGPPTWGLQNSTQLASASITSPATDGTNGNPRTGQFTRPRGLGVYFYEYVGTVN